MKLIRFLAPASETISLKNLIGKNLFSVFLAALTLSNATLNTARDVSSPLFNRSETLAASTVPLGLSRKRPDFIKAIDMLAEAAATSPYLAGYYEGVAQRVKGDRADGENISGIEVVKRPRRSRPMPPKTATINASAADLPSKGVSAMDRYAQSVFTPESLSESIQSTETDISQDSTDRADANTPGSSEPFTVGDMAFDTNPAIEHWMNYYGATPVGRRTMSIGILRSNDFIEMAREEFRNAGVPEDLVWLALVESVWNPRAVSPAAAGGIWQFIPSTATDYGLTVQSGNDERADPLKQTRVAAAYLHDLHTIFGDWALAMAAYNSGEPRVMSAIVKNGGADFWDLYNKQLLPKETCNYVPKILAAIKIAGQAERYGLPQSETEPSAGG